MKTKAGRPKKENTKKPLSIRLYDEQIELLKKIGDGKVQKGIEYLIRKALN